ncbi:MAG: transcription elongation factor Spt5 [Desulfurococcales archaeon]|jgi:transcriptional antiterminator NusG|nr:transcription elongation factor Spt5 [Desulfurococcales archaeon]
MSSDKPSEKGDITQLFAVRTTGGQEANVALMVEMFVESSRHSSGRKIDVRAIVVPPGIKGYVILEVPSLHMVYQAVKDIKHVKGKAAGAVSFKDLEKMLKPAPVIEELKEKMLVEIVSGPFKGLKGTIQLVDKNRMEVTVAIVESQFPMNITVPAEFVKPIKQQ